MKRNIISAMKDCTITFCISYTIVSFILSALNMANPLIDDNVWQHNLELLFVCFIIALLMFLARIIFEPSQKPYISPMVVMTDLLLVGLPVLGLGGFVFHWFDPFSAQILYPIFILLVVYILTAAIFYLNAKHTEKELNKKITERKERKNHDKQNDRSN